MNRTPNSKKGWAFWLPTKGGEGRGVEDRYGRVYAADANGTLRLVKDKERGKENPKLANRV